MTWRRGELSLGAILLAALGAAVLLAATPAEAQTDPPAFGMGNWNIADSTVVEDDFIMMSGDVFVRSGGNLSLRNVTILFKCQMDNDYELKVFDGGTLTVVNCTLGAAKIKVLWYLHAEESSTVSILDSRIQECSGVEIETNDATVRDCSIEGGRIGLIVPQNAPPVRNCSFSQVFGVYTSGTAVEDCVFMGHTHNGIRVVGGTPRIERCRFERMQSCGVYLRWGGAMIQDCTFTKSTRGIWTQHGCSLTRVMNCTFEKVEKAISIRNGFVEIVNGRFLNCSEPVESLRESRIDWTVTEEAVANGGPVSLSGDVVVQEGARLRCAECIEFLQWNREFVPRTIALGRGATFELVNTSLGPPEPDPRRPWLPKDGVPLVFSGEDGTLSLSGVGQLNLSFPVQLEALLCRETRLPLGTWYLEYVEMVDCVLCNLTSKEPALMDIWGRKGPSGLVEAGRLVRCDLEGLPTGPSRPQPWLVIARGRLHSLDTLFDLGAHLESGGIGLPEAEGVASVEACWTMRVKVVWQSQVPLPQQTVHIEDREGPVATLVTDEDGTTVARGILTEVAGSADEVRCRYPIIFRANSSGLEGMAQLERVTGPVEVTVVVKDLVPPSLDIDQGTQIATNRSTMRVTGRAVDAHSGLAFVEAAFASEDFFRVPVIRSNGSFSFQVELATGLQVLLVRAYDWVGNRAVWSLEIYHSMRSPYLTVHEPADGSWVCTELVMVYGETDPDSTVEVGGRVQHTENGTFRLFVTLEEGENTLRVVSTNRAGNRNDTLIRLRLDTVAPSLEVLEPDASPVFTREAHQKIWGRAELGCTVMINTVMLDMDARGEFNATASLKQGHTLYNVRAIDHAGNEAIVEVVFVLDSVPPELVIERPPAEGLWTNRTAITLIMETDMLTHVDGEPTGDVFTVNGVEVNVTERLVRVELDLLEGRQEVTVRVEDAAGNHQEVSRTVWVDTTPPRLELVVAPPNRTAEANLQVVGRTEPGASVTVIGLVTSVEGNGTFTRRLLLSSGENTIEMVSMDDYGNRAVIVVEVEMIPRGPEPVEEASSLVPPLLLLMTVILVLEGVALVLHGRRGQSGNGASPP